MISQFPKCAARKNIPLFFFKHCRNMSSPAGSPSMSLRTRFSVSRVAQRHCKAETARFWKDFLMILFFSSGDFESAKIISRLIFAERLRFPENRKTRLPNPIPILTTICWGRGCTSNSSKLKKKYSRKFRIDFNDLGSRWGYCSAMAWAIA